LLAPPRVATILASADSEALVIAVAALVDGLAALADGVVALAGALAMPADALAVWLVAE
jgi:hypothetical protein